MTHKFNASLITLMFLGTAAQAGIHLPHVHSGKGDSSSIPGAGDLKNSLEVDGVKVSKKHMLGTTYGNWGRWTEDNPCKGFKGTFEGNTLSLHAEATGGDGRYLHTLVLKYGSSYQLGPKESAQIQLMRSGAQADFKVTLPSLSDDVPYVQQSAMLVTEDGKGHSATSTLIFTVSRPVILSPSQDAAMVAKNCFQRYSPYEAITGVLSNATNNASQIQIHQGIEKLWTSTKGWQWGVYVQPQAFGISLIAVDYSYFQQTSKSVSETTEVVTDYNFDPGDYMQVYVQPTRYVTMYDARLIDACGNETLAPGAYAFQWWGFAYQVAPINPYAKQPPSLQTVGAPAMNSCPATFDENSAKADHFWRTNS